VLFLNKNKSKDKTNKIMLINGSLEFEKGRPKNFIPDEKIKKIAKAFHSWKDIEKFVKIIAKDEVAKNDYNLSPSRYVGNGQDEEYRDVEEILVELAEIEEERTKTDKELNSIMKKIGYKGFLG
jgi:type I restriction enzyme M protein